MHTDTKAQIRQVAESKYPGLTSEALAKVIDTAYEIHTSWPNLSKTHQAALDAVRAKKGN